MRQFLSRIKIKAQHFQQLSKRKVEKFVIWASCHDARRHLRAFGPYSILIDTSVLGNSVTHETAWVSTGTKKWGDLPVDTGYMARIPIHSPENDSRIYNEIRYLIGIAKLSREGHLKPFTSAELIAEQDRQPQGRFRGYSLFDLSLWDGIKVPSVDGRVSDWRDSDGSRQRVRILQSNSEIFKSIKSYFPGKSSQDTFHLSTAIERNMYFYLTMDFKFIEQYEQARRRTGFPEHHCQAMLPSRLAQTLGIKPIHSFIITHQGSSWFAREDLHMPEQRRYKRSRQSRSE